MTLTVLNRVRWLLMAAFCLFGMEGSAAERERIPRLFLIGDSTVQNKTKGFQGWGTPFVKWVDPKLYVVDNRANGGRSSRSYLRERWWDAVLKELQTGDVVIIQFGHNDSESLESGLGSLPGIGTETRQVTFKGAAETVRSYGSYLAGYVADVKAKGALPIICSPLPVNHWKGKKILRDRHDYAEWAEEIADALDVHFIDLEEIVAKRYEALGKDSVSRLCFNSWDVIHTTPIGAGVIAECVATAIWKLNVDTLSNAMHGSPRK